MLAILVVFKQRHLWLRNVAKFIYLFHFVIFFSTLSDCLAQDQRDTEKYSIHQGQNEHLNLGGHISTWTVPVSKYWLSSPDDKSLKNELNGLFALFLEWNFMKFSKVGAILLNAQSSAFFPSMSGEPSEKDGMSHLFVTFHLFSTAQLYETSRVNIGGILGYSFNSSYSRWRLNDAGKLKESQNQEMLDDNDFDKEIVKGSASIFEFYCDLNHRVHGFRLSIFALKTDFGRLNDGTKPDGSGYGYYLSYYYSFSL